MGSFEQLGRFWHVAVAALSIVLAILASGHALLHKRDSRAAVAWVGLIWLVPLGGAVLYFVLGVNRIRRRAILLRGHLERFRSEAAVEDCSPEALEWELPEDLRHLAAIARVLGPRGLMPNPKTGTVTFDVAKAVRDAKAGKLEYRTDRGANVHIPIGKRSFEERALVENYAALIDEIVRAKPAAAKGRYIKKITLTSTMGPGIHVDPTRTRDIAEELESASASEEATVQA